VFALKALMHRQQNSNAASSVKPIEAGKWTLFQKTGPVFFHLGNSSVILIGSEGCDINIQVNIFVVFYTL
jgi:hypothetical protein